MLLLKYYNNKLYKLISFPSFKLNIRKSSSVTNLKQNPNCKAVNSNIIEDDDLIKLLDKHHSSILYSSFVENKCKQFGYIHQRKSVSLKKFLENKEEEIRFQEAQNKEPIPLCLKYITNEQIIHSETDNIREKNTEQEEPRLTHFPFKNVSDTVNDSNVNKEENIQRGFEDHTVTIETEVRARQQTCTNETVMNWMVDYDNYDDRYEGVIDDNWKQDYGTPDPKSCISNVPCGGCGALLHCKDTAIPGYIPSEIYKNYNKAGAVSLQGLICQRCHFLKHYNIALQARVAPEDYPKILQTVSQKNAMVVLMVDLLDFPCSIWPGIADILGEKPIIIVGNKVDLLPQDGPNFLKHITDVLVETVRLSGFASTDIRGVELISAKTGFGIEKLITRLLSLWRIKGDVYIVGCTNVGKSTLFNILLQSDFCKVQAADLIQRATTSPWPGTTLNLLKFPIMRPSAHRIEQRNKRLNTVKQLAEEEKKLRKWHYNNTRNPEYATLIGHIDRTFTANKASNASSDAFGMQQKPYGLGQQLLGINENNNDFKFSRWCYDTPGVVQPDQIVHLLTTEELILTLPKQIIQAKTFVLKPQTTIFLGGLARLDYIEGTESIKFVVFRSDSIPITICQLDNAEQIYNEFLGTEVFKVPMNQPERLEKWPKLEPSREFQVTGIDSECACTDVVLSSAGWISVVGKPQKNYVVKGWTPEGRGVYLRTPLLPRAVQFRGHRKSGSPAFVSDKLFIE